jgi:hypothetical protein
MKKRSRKRLQEYAMDVDRMWVRNADRNVKFQAALFSSFTCRLSNILDLLFIRRPFMWSIIRLVFFGTFSINLEISFVNEMKMVLE